MEDASEGFGEGECEAWRAFGCATKASGGFFRVVDDVHLATKASPYSTVFSLHHSSPTSLTAQEHRRYRENLEAEAGKMRIHLGLGPRVLRCLMCEGILKLTRLSGP